MIALLLRNTYTQQVSEFELVLTFGIHKQCPAELENITGVAEKMPIRKNRKDRR